MTTAVRRYVTLLILAGLLSLLLLYQISAFFIPSLARGAANATLSPSPSPADTVSVSSRDSTLYEVIRARPLFNTTRRPVIISLATAISSDLPLTLVGILRAPHQSFAIARMPGNPNLIFLAHGTNIQGWMVTDIERGRVTLEAGQMKQILTLQQGKND